jgi:short-subunit dehydrogenase
MELSDKLVIITGASRGIGCALAIELAKSGCGLLLTGLEGDELLALSNEVRSKFSAPIEPWPVICQTSNHAKISSTG